MPTIIVKFFGPARDLASEDAITLEIVDRESLGAVAGRIAEMYPRLAATLGVRLAVNRQFAPLDRALLEGDEVAVIPPVSGGSPEPRVRLTREMIDADALVRDLQTTQAGAVVSFVGAVRAEIRDGRPLAALEYHAYEPMALEQMQAIREATLKRFDIVDLAITHRLGWIELGEASVAIVAVAAHRDAAFEACRWVIDRIKTDAPIWKREVWADGAASWTALPV